MPSTADESSAIAIAGTNTVYTWSRKWLAKSHSQSIAKYYQLWKRIERVDQALEAGVLGDATPSLLNLLKRDLPPALAASLPFLGNHAIPPPEELPNWLRAAETLVLDYAMHQDPNLSKRYLKRLYCALDSALRFNATTDLNRIRPLLLWIRAILIANKRSDCSFVDVGCSMTNGAPSTILAANLLRSNQLCREIHGTDVTPPPRDQARQALSDHHVLLYAADPISRRLPRDYDIILLANVHRHLDRILQEKLLQNLGASLREGGHLFVNWRFNNHFSPCLCLHREGTRLQFAGEGNFASTVE